MLTSARNTVVRKSGILLSIAILCASLSVGAASSWAEDNADKSSASTDVRDRVAREDFIVHVHRGAGLRFPENTLPACEKSWKQPGAIPECDVRTSKDGVFCAFHDDNFARVVKNAPPELKKKAVKHLTWEELSRLDVGAYAGEQFAGQRIAKLEDVFAAMQNHPRRLVCLDFKEASLDKLAALAKKYDVEKQIVFATTIYKKIREWKKLAPSSQTLYWMGGSEESLAKRIAELRQANFQSVTQLEIHVQVGELNSDEPFKPSSAFLRSVADELRSRHIPFVAMPWANADPRAYEKLLQLGADAFSTDYPDATKQVLDAFYERKLK
jgi:glycerophosphoryl diester phosphodiesterase